jgi:hypothetical protein
MGRAVTGVKTWLNVPCVNSQGSFDCQDCPPGFEKRGKFECTMPPPTLGSSESNVQPEATMKLASGGNRYGVQGAHLNPLGLFLRTSIPFRWRVLSAFLPA